MKVKPIFRWFDFWIGLYWDRRNRHLYVMPLPMLGFRLSFRFRYRCHLPNCGRPAVYTCLEPEWIEKGLWLRSAVRDQLCATHGQPGPCPKDKAAVHYEIAPKDRYYFEEEL